MEALSKLGIDWQSMLVYIVNIGILFGVIAYLVTGPLIKVLDQRRKEIKDNIEKAESIKNEFMHEKLKSEKERQAFKAQMERQLSDLKVELELRRQEQEKSLEIKRSKMLSEVKELVEEEKAGILKKAELQTLALIEKVVLYTVSHGIPEDMIKKSVHHAWDTLQDKKSS